MVKKKKIPTWMVSCLILIFLAFAILVFLRSPENDWIKDEKGVWIKHGNPSFVPEQVKTQQDAITCANEAYAGYPKENISSQCLGTCWDYSVDIVHVPRQSVDDNAENQCLDYRQGLTHHFIELDKDGNIVRIA
ncbi:MAG: hypothetical protein ABIH28_04030 [archaeon]